MTKVCVRDGKSGVKGDVPNPSSRQGVSCFSKAEGLSLEKCSRSSLAGFPVQLGMTGCGAPQTSHDATFPRFHEGFTADSPLPREGSNLSEGVVRRALAQILRHAQDDSFLLRDDFFWEKSRGVV
jgi:hypothetical protein